MIRIWESLGTWRAVRFISITMIVYFLVLGLLTYGYAQVSHCLADYADRSAASTTARAEAAFQDRQLDIAERDLAESDRIANRAFSRALTNVLSTVGQERSKRIEAFQALLEQDAKTNAQLDRNDEEREKIKKARQRNEEYRKQNPIPPPPSEIC